MKKSDFYYDLPHELIAQHPSEKRDLSRLMVLKPDHTIEDKIFHDIVDYLNPGDCLVINNTKVIPARLLGHRKDTGSPVEFLLLKELPEKKYEVMVRPGKKCKVGHTIEFLKDTLEADIIEVCANGNRIVQFKYEGIWQEILANLGEMPLPPYITEKLEDKNRYQTIYAKYDGSAAAPTAGLHFTQELLQQIKQKGIEIAEITLHVGIGTFRPVKEENIEEHFMHSEFYHIDQETAELINQCKANHGRIIAVGTTSCRVLETVADPKTGLLKASQGNTDIFIYPGYKFKILDGLITNFHLPESTLLMLVSALYGKESILKAYQHAIQENYRFFSFGDAMFIMP
ncbi:MAG: tRNA preQ1(34) S-adenosylmethionine ribosyltransferase-isomerase QueA [Clostridiaceae bacterium]|nr:tRNA preQ1(34) S-adenosylmethionine ribosyltransferase-isomerase QueA [Clostridiaceae bacterium]